MTPKQVLDYYKSYHYFKLRTGMSASSLWNWIKWGYVPILSQMKLEKLTGGKLKASIGDANGH